MRNELLETCLLAGRIMIEGGSEMYRVDDTMVRIAQNGGAKNALVFTTLTGIFIGLEDSPLMKLSPIHQRSINMEKVAQVNQLSREFAAHELTLRELHMALHKLDEDTPVFPFWLEIVAAAVCSMMLMVVFAQAYDWIDMPLAAIAGALGYVAYAKLSHITQVRFISELAGAFVVGVSAWIGVRIGIGQNLDNVIIGAVMPLVPGVALTNAIRDMLSGHLLSGLARGMEALLSAAAIGVGIALIFRFF